MFGLGIWEIAVILVVALVVLGPKKLPGAAKQLGRSLREFRKAASEFQVSLEQEADEQERKEIAEKRRAEFGVSTAADTNEPQDSATAGSSVPELLSRYDNLDDQPPPEDLESDEVVDSGPVSPRPESSLAAEEAQGGARGPVEPVEDSSDASNSKPPSS